MRTSSVVRGTASAASGMLLVGIASVPAHAAGVKQWQLDAYGAEEIWQLSKGEGVTVAVIDSGVDKDNPDLRGRVLRGKDFATGKPGDETTDYDGHGTSMAGLIAGTGQRDGGNGAFGLAPAAKILPVRVPGAADSAEFIRVVPDAIRFAADSGVKVIDISTAVATDSPQLAEAAKYALDKGALVFAGVGDDAEKGNKPMYPAATPGVVGVGATDDKARRIPMSQYGPQVDLVAPGKDTVAACGTGICKSSGTGNAAALVSAAAALLWSKHPDWTNNQVLKVMLNTVAKPSGGEEHSNYVGYGAARPLRTLKTPGDPGPAGVRPIDDLAENITAPSASASATPAPRRPPPKTAATPPSGSAWGSVRPCWSVPRSPYPYSGPGGAELDPCRRPSVTHSWGSRCRSTKSGAKSAARPRR